MGAFSPALVRANRPSVSRITDAVRAALGGFNPRTLFADGKKGFAYDFLDPSKLFQNSNGTGTVTTLNDPIGYVTDLSGNNQHGTQATAGSRPLFDPANGAIGDGSKSISCGTLDLSGVTALTVIACVQTSSTSNQGIFNHGSFNDGDASLIMNSAAGGRYVSTLNGATADPSTFNSRGGVGSNFKVVTSVFDRTKTSPLEQAATRIDGELYGNSQQSAGVSGTANFTSRVAQIMNWYGGTGLNGKLVRIIVIGGLLNPSELYAAERWAGQGGGLSLITELPPSGDAFYSGLVSYGQSLSLGVSSSPVLSATRRFSQDFMLSGGTEPWSPSTNYTSLVALSEGNKTISASDCGESPLSGAVEMLHEQGYQLSTISSANGFPSLTIAQLSKGQIQYNTNLAVILNHWRRAREQFRHYKIRAVTWMQGESDGGNATYAASMNTLRTDLDADIKATTLQTDDVWLLSYQLSRAQIGLEHLKAQETYSKIVIAAPTYHLAKADGVHLTNTGSKVMGAYFGLAYKRIVADGNTAWKPLMATGVAVSGANIDLTYNVPMGQLAFDTTTVPAQTNQGFRLVDSGGSPLTISSVTITGTNTIRIVAASSVPAGAKVYYGFSNPENNTAGTDIGNLRDTQGSTIVFDGGGLNYPMHNWAVLQLVQLP